MATPEEETSGQDPLVEKIDEAYDSLDQGKTVRRAEQVEQAYETYSLVREILDKLERN